MLLISFAALGLLQVAHRTEPDIQDRTTRSSRLRSRRSGWRRSSGSPRRHLRVGEQPQRQHLHPGHELLRRRRGRTAAPAASSTAARATCTRTPSELNGATASRRSSRPTYHELLHLLARAHLADVIITTHNLRQPAAPTTRSRSATASPFATSPGRWVMRGIDPLRGGLHDRRGPRRRDAARDRRGRSDATLAGARKATYRVSSHRSPAMSPSGRWRRFGGFPTPAGDDLGAGHSNEPADPRTASAPGTSRSTATAPTRADGRQRRHADRRRDGQRRNGEPGPAGVHQRRRLGDHPAVHRLAERSNCQELLCPGTQDFKRAIVAVSSTRRRAAAPAATSSSSRT